MMDNDEDDENKLRLIMVSIKRNLIITGPIQDSHQSQDEVISHFHYGLDPCWRQWNLAAVEVEHSYPQAKPMHIPAWPVLLETVNNIS
uniref:Uncharacterized protein n=1 Tax=Fagus sylvatica TaxID=28930 RepID=A0A2N9GVT1_FAGSY